MIHRVRRLLFFFFFFSSIAWAQFTAVTGSVVDPHALPYANGTISATLSSPGGTSVTLNGLPYTPPIQPTGLDKNGSFTLNIADNTQLAPAGTKWNFTVCSAAGTVTPALGTGSQCFSLAAPITISGAAQDISAQLNAVALALTVIVGGGGIPGGLNTQIQYNNSGAFGAISNVAPGSFLASEGASAVPLFQLKPVVDVRDYGTFGDNSSHTITQVNINSHNEWLGCGTVNTAGTAVSWVSGAKFYPTILNTNINVGGADFSVSAIGPTTDGVATTLTLGSSAGTQSGARWCMYATGDQADYVGLQESIFTALGAAGAEHSSTNSFLNREIMIPAGSYLINKTLNITHGAGVHIWAAQRFAVFLKQLSNNMPILQTNGFSYSKIEGIFWRPQAGVSGTTAALVEVTWDGTSGTWTQGLQADSFSDNVFSGEGTLWQIGVRIGGNGFMGSENLFLNNHWLWFTTGCLVTSNFDALQNTVVGGNFQNCSGDGIHVTAGSVYVYSVGFQDGTPISNPAQTGFDINILNSANDTNVIESSRTESSSFVSLTNQPRVSIIGNHQVPASVAWVPNHSFTVPGTGLVRPPANSPKFVGGAFSLSSSCTTGGSEPNWTYTTTPDNTCTWTYQPVTFLSGSPQGTIIGNSVELGGIINMNGAPAMLMNNTFSRADWMNPNGTPPNTVGNNQLLNCFNFAYPGGGPNTASLGPWYIKNPSGDNRIFQGASVFSQCNLGAQALIFSTGGSGTIGQDVGIGHGQNPQATSPINDSILALVGSTAGGLGINPKMGRRDSFGTDQTGKDQDIAAGRGTGAGASGNINFWTHSAGASGSTLGTLIKRWTIDPAGNLSAVFGKGQHINPQAANNDISGTCTLAGGSCTVTFTTAYSSAPVCVATDQTAAAAVQSAPTTTNVVFTGTGTDIVAYHCIGNPN